VIKEQAKQVTNKMQEARKAVLWLLPAS
jgi:hypothetical protein